MKPISEWTDEELRAAGTECWRAKFLAAEVLRLREWGRVHFGQTERDYEAMKARAEKAEADAAYGRAARVADWQARSLAAEAALARVRAQLCGCECCYDALTAMEMGEQ